MEIERVTMQRWMLDGSGEQFVGAGRSRLKLLVMWMMYL